MRQFVDEKLMVFESTPDFSDNSRALWEYVDKNTDYATFRVVKDQKMAETLKERGIDCGLEGEETSESMVEKARFLITSSFQFAYQKKPGQIHVSAWHGFPLKLIGFFDSASGDQGDFNALKIMTTQSDLIVAPSRLSQLTLSGMFAVDPRKVKETGYPRNDIMFWSDGKKELAKITDIDVVNSRLIFYLPTMRKGLKDEGDQFEDNLFNYSDYDVERIDRFLEENNAYIFAKVHFADNGFFTREDVKLPERMIFLDTEILNEKLLTIYHIMNAFDVLITDYSSVYADFLLLNKPIIFSCPDIDKYQKDRGFIVDDPRLLMPGAVIGSQTQLLDTLKDILAGRDDYRAVRAEKMAFFHRYQDAGSSKRLFLEMVKASEYGIEDSAKKMGYSFLDETSPLHQYADKTWAEIFFDTGEGFCEASKTVIEYKAEGEEHPVAFVSEIPESSRAVRFDPDHDGRFILRNLEVLLDGVPSEYEIVNGFRLEEDIIFYEKDPQIVINLGGKTSHKIRIEFRSVDLHSEAGKLIRLMDKKLAASRRGLAEANKRLADISASRSWKITRPLRDAGRAVKSIRAKR